MSNLSTLLKIKLHFIRVPMDQMVSSREILIHGERSAVDSAIYILVKTKVIWRIARGVFIRAGGRLPSVAEIAEFKARAFDRNLRIHGDDAASEFQIVPETIDKSNKQNTFYVDGSSSSFAYTGGRIQFKGICKKRMRLEDTATGRAIRGLWHLGARTIRSRDLANPALPWHSSDEALELFLRSKQWMPAWLGDKIQASGYIGP